MNPSPKSQPGGETYDPDYFAPLFAIEDRHFWFKARNAIISAVVRQITGSLPAGYRVLEVGCGTGSVLRVLEQASPDGRVFGMDLFSEGLRFARQRVHCPLVQGDVRQPPYCARFDLIGMFDVMEHLPDALGVLKDLYQMLAPGGALVLTVPAYQSLWSYFDEVSRHVKRYEVDDLSQVLREAGFRVDYVSPYMMTIFPLVWLNRRLASLLPSKPSDTNERNRDLTDRELRIVPVANDVLAWLLSQEARAVTRRKRLPFGTSLIAIARK